MSVTILFRDGSVIVYPDATRARVNPDESLSIMAGEEEIALLHLEEVAEAKDA